MYGKNNERISAVYDIVFHFMRIYDVGRRVGEARRQGRGGFSGEKHAWKRWIYSFDERKNRRNEYIKIKFEEV